MNLNQKTQRIAIIGGGPAGLFIYKKLVDTGNKNLTIAVFEEKKSVGSGLPYSKAGAGYEHITNVSGNEIPDLVIPIVEWMATLPPEKLKTYHIDPKKFSAYKVFPRLLFGEYLQAQFVMLQQKATAAGIITNCYTDCRVTDVRDQPEKNNILVHTGNDEFEFDRVIICTGHRWPLVHEGKTPGYFDSPYPPAKLSKRFNHTVAIKGSALTAIDALRTLGRCNGEFIETAPHQTYFKAHEDAQHFKIVMYSLGGLLPGIRFHLDDTHLSPKSMLSKEEIDQHIKENGGFLSLDFIFEKDFKKMLQKKDPVFYDHIKDMRMEAFVNEMMTMREQADPIALFKAEYAEAALSIERKKSVYWKEMLSALSFAMNYPAKHLSAEDMLRLKKVLMPLISIIIAFVPQDSCEELLALYEAGCLEIIPVDEDSHVEINPAGGIVYHHTDQDGNKHEISYSTFIDCSGQKQLSIDDFPFKSMVNAGTLSQAYLPFRSAEEAKKLLVDGNKDIEAGEDNDFWLKVPGITITDSFRVVDKNGADNPRIYMMAVPYIGGYNPDYSGLDFCEEAADTITTNILATINKV